MWIFFVFRVVATKRLFESVFVLTLRPSIYSDGATEFIFYPLGAIKTYFHYLLGLSGVAFCSSFAFICVSLCGMIDDIATCEIVGEYCCIIVLEGIGGDLK